MVPIGVSLCPTLLFDILTWILPVVYRTTGLGCIPNLLEIAINADVHCRASKAILLFICQILILFAT